MVKEDLSVVISCAGMGSRLGRSKTKSLIDVCGKTIIRRQLEMLDDVQDIRIVVGYQADLVIEEVKKYRSDAVFIYNNDYMTTKTGMSFYLGANDGLDRVIELDGDLLVNPDDMDTLINLEGEWIAYSEATSDETVYVRTDSNGRVLSFSREFGDYEWTGPACKYKKNLAMPSATDNVFNMLEPGLPTNGVLVRAYDIDTENDYKRVCEIVSKW